MGKYVAINRHSRTIRNSIAELVVMVLVVMELEEVVLELVLMGRIVDYKIRRNNSSGLVVVAVELVEEMEMAVELAEEMEMVMELAEEMEMEMELAEETDYLHMDWAHPHCLHSFQTLRYNSQVDNTDTQQNYPVRIL
jgi:hypothetical protein